MSLVRSDLQSNDRGRALDQATQCRRLVPDLMPSEDAHPANVMAVLREADDRLVKQHLGRLTVTSAPTSHCPVYLNGRPLGTTPFVLERAAAGDYRVQAECNGASGRVHMVKLGDQPVTLAIDTHLDLAISSDPRLSLHYANDGEALARAVSDATQLGRDVSASDVILLHVQDGKAELLRVRVAQQRLAARAVAPWTEQGFSLPALAQALAALADGEQADPPGYRETIDDAVSEMAEHKYDEARALFARAHQLAPSARTHRGLGLAEFSLRNYEACIDQLEAALQSEAKPLQGDLRQETERLLKRARTYVGLVDVKSEPAATEVLVDESFARPADAPLRLTAGAHVLDLTIPGHSLVRRHVQVRGGERQTLRVVLASPSHERAERAERRWYKSPWLWTAVGLAAASAAVGVAFAVRDPGTRTSDAWGGSTGRVANGPGRTP
ncbi:MAG TPA: PEGA domain-containing protein [Polyangiales bacterium]|nr:PEGA domain-containing protein [Polyangiales bacterium]